MVFLSWLELGPSTATGLELWGLDDLRWLLQRVARLTLQRLHLLPGSLEVAQGLLQVVLQLLLPVLPTLCLLQQLLRQQALLARATQLPAHVAVLPCHLRDPVGLCLQPCVLLRQPGALEQRCLQLCFSFLHAPLCCCRLSAQQLAFTPPRTQLALQLLHLLLHLLAR
jgi:hypothetical protein